MVCLVNKYSWKENFAGFLCVASLGWPEALCTVGGCAKTTICVDVLCCLND